VEASWSNESMKTVYHSDRMLEIFKHEGNDLNIGGRNRRPEHGKVSPNI
jgi:hypothetical protein